MYAAYNFLLAVTFVLALPYFLVKGLRTGKYLKSLRERLGRVPPDLNPARAASVWIHAVSVGEVLAVRALVEPLRRRFPGHPLLLSTTTLTGNAVARKSLVGVDGLFFAPFDLRGPVRRVLEAVNPSLLILVETELWPNLIHEARRRGTRVALVNGRISPRSFPRYRRIRSFLKRVLADVDLFLMQGEAHVRRILEMGAPPERVKNVGNLKYDAVTDAATPAALARLLDGAVRSPLWVAGSTVAGEEAYVLEAYRRVRERVPAARLLIAPRHPERFAEVPRLIEGAGFRCVRRSLLEPGGWRNGEVLLLDTLGELAQVYPLATVVFVGGSLMPAGGHNVLEAAVAGKPVVVGPHMENFQEIADEFRAAGALVQLDSEAALASEVTALLLDDERRGTIGGRARSLIERNRGAAEHTLDVLARLVA
jgi:3-deoxy-D-manno-octulosonic-acid transferase